MGNNNSFQYDSALDSSSDTTLNTVVYNTRMSPAIMQPPQNQQQSLPPMTAAKPPLPVMMMQHQAAADFPGFSVGGRFGAKMSSPAAVIRNHSCEGIYGHQMRLNTMQQQHHRASPAISEPIYVRLPSASGSSCSTEVPIMEAIKCTESIYAAKSEAAAASAETDRLLANNGSIANQQ